jgi:hypothetical protein
VNRIIRRLPHLSHGDRESERANQEAVPAEDPVVRQYRFLLRTAPADALEAAHLEALRALEASDRLVVLSTVQTVLVAGLRLGADDVHPLAHLVTSGERRVPGALLANCPERVLRRLAGKVIHSEAAFGLFSGYAGWDGAEPEPSPDDADMAGWDEHWHQELLRRTQISDHVDGYGSGDTPGQRAGY